MEILPAATALGLEAKGLPTAEEMAAVRRFAVAAKVRPVLVGEDMEDQATWRIAGSLKPEYLTDIEALDGPAICVGKVVKVVESGRWYPLVTIPGMNLMGREERRKLERTPPKPKEEKNYLKGPALLLDMLAVYR